MLWRLSRHPGLDGVGGLHAGARWSSKGRRIVYAAESPAGALIEVLVHLQVENGEMPEDYRLIGIAVPAALIPEAIAGLPRGWKADFRVSRAKGDAWLTRGRSALVRVPSAIIDETANVLINPAHPDAAKLQIAYNEPFDFDARFFG